jgi:hypothetical protein
MILIFFISKLQIKVIFFNIQMSINRKDIKELFYRLTIEPALQTEIFERATFIKNIRTEGRPEKIIDITEGRTSTYKSYVAEVKAYKKYLKVNDPANVGLVKFLETQKLLSLEQVKDKLDADPNSVPYLNYLSEMTRKKYRSPKYNDLCAKWIERNKLKLEMNKMIKDGDNVEQINQNIAIIEASNNMKEFIEFKEVKNKAFRISPSVIEHLSDLCCIIVGDLVESSILTCGKNNDKTVNTHSHLDPLDLIKFQTYPLFANSLPFKLLDNREKRRSSYMTGNNFAKSYSKKVGSSISFESKEESEGHCIKKPLERKKVKGDKQSTYIVMDYRWVGIDDEVEEALKHLISTINTAIKNRKQKMFVTYKISKQFKIFATKTVLSFMSNIFRKFMLTERKTLNIKTLNMILRGQIIDFSQEQPNVSHSIYEELLSLTDDTETDESLVLL